ncbi:unnamed protein product, partial [marine sediment metagenome]
GVTDALDMAGSVPVSGVPVMPHAVLVDVLAGNQ